jgi:uncharacterized membrane protein
MSALRKWLFTGLLVIVPGVITAWVLNWIVSTLDQTLQILPGAGTPTSCWVFPYPRLWRAADAADLAGGGRRGQQFCRAQAGAVGRRPGHRIPVVRSIYSSVKQVSDTLFSESGNAFRTAVLVQWPREGVWTVAFVTGTPRR